MKIAVYILSLAAVILSQIGCATVAFQYRGMLCAIEHCGASAPASIAFIYAIPFAIAIAVCIVLAIVFFKKSMKTQ